MANDNTSDILEYAVSQVTTCTLVDGYICDEISEDNFLSHQSLEQLVPAIYFPAWHVAHHAFQNLEDLTSQQKDLKHYRIGMTESDKAYIILFSALLLPEKIVNHSPQGMSRITFGQTTKFWIDKKSLEVTKYLFYK